MIIDMHTHIIEMRSSPDETQEPATCASQIARLDEEGIDRAVVLPFWSSPECLPFMQILAPQPDPFSQLREVLRYPERLIPFGLLDPRMGKNTAHTDFSWILEQLVGMGCVGIGEILANLPADDPRVINLFRQCGRWDLPVLIHVTGPGEGYYGLIDETGSPRLERLLQEAPDTVVIGHGPGFWAEIGGGLTNEAKCHYPSGPVLEGGSLPRLLGQYPNLYAEISAMSGHNALTRDPAFGLHFIHEFQDKILFGTDVLGRDMRMPHLGMLRQMLAEGQISQDIFDKIAGANALRVLPRYEQGRTLALKGGTPFRRRPFPSVGNTSGRWLGEEEKRLLGEVIESGALNRNDGTKVAELERTWATMHGVPYAQAVTSGTAALHTAVAALNLEPGDEVITTPITDMGTVIAILACNLVPIFADVDPRTGNITAETIARQLSPKTRALIVVHLFGQPAEMDPILDLARRHNLRVIEDCAQAHLAEYHGRLVGTMGDLGCFSYQQSKQMTTGDGGMVITRDEALAQRARLFADKGWPRGIPGLRGHLFLGYNYRMTELQGAVGLAQVGKLAAIVARRRETATKLCERLAAVEGLKAPFIIPTATPSWWIFSFTIDADALHTTPDDFAQAMRAEGLPFGLGYIPHPVFEYDVIRERKTYGTSGIPWTLPQARAGIQYDRRDYPGTLQFLAQTFVTSWNEGMSAVEVYDIAGALSKVARCLRAESR